MSTPTPVTRVLIFGGKTGWIGGLMSDLCEKDGESSRQHGAYCPGNFNIKMSFCIASLTSNRHDLAFNWNARPLRQMKSSAFWLSLGLKTELTSRQS